MRGILPMLLRLATTLLSAELLVLAIAKDTDELTGNLLSHVYERLFLWTRYDAFCEIYGASEQKVVLPQFRPSEQKPEPDFDYRWNKGSDTDRKYTFGEFQVRIAKKNWHRFFESEKAKYNSLRAPWSDGNSERPTIHEVATRIFNLGFRQPVHVLDLDSTLGLERFAEEPFRELQDPSLWDREDPWKTDFHYYFENLEAEFQHVFRSYSRSQPQAQARAQAPASWRDVVVGSSQVSWRDVVVGSSQVVAEDSAKRAAKLAILKKNHELGMELVEVILTLRIEAHKRHFFKQSQTVEDIQR
ncbi:hypothetical protein CTA2_459 [Colletotrichum tanaceti]|nr:hypothetical protein CTA2_459 [Colletotrichum tanaceti]